MRTILNFNPRAEEDVAWADRVYMIWPAVAWRVVAPLPEDRRINILQKAVLSLCRSGSFSEPEIATTLHLHPRLVAVIGQELVGSGWVDSENWQPTSQGLAILNEQETAMSSLVTGWVFQNPLNTDLWPFFSRQLQLQDFREDAAPGRLTLLQETKRGVRSTAAWEIRSVPGSSQPTSEAILTAIRRFRRREKLKGYMRLADSGLDQLHFENAPELVSRISFISEQPEPVGLVTYGFHTANGSALPQICDPFGFGCSREMWRHIEQLARDDQGAARAQRELLQRAGVQDGPALQGQLNHQQQRAEAEIIACLSLDIRTTPAVLEHLVAAQNALLLAKATEGRNKSHLAAVLNNCRKALEALLKEVARKSPLRDAHKQLVDDEAQDRSVLVSIAQRLGFKIPVPPKLLNTLNGQYRKQIENMGRDLGALFSLPRAVVASLLAANKDLKHPLRAAAAKDPELLHKLFQLIVQGNEGSHDDSHVPDPKQLTMNDSSQQLHLTLQVTSSLLELPFNSTT